jgi:dimethylargininase
MIKRYFSKILFTRKPSPNLCHGIVSHHLPSAQPSLNSSASSSINYEVAFQQWKNYAAIFQSLSWQVHELPTPDKENTFPDSVFIEDCLFTLQNSQNPHQKIFLITRPGHPQRVNEINNIEAYLRNCNHFVVPPIIHSIQDPGTLDGGNILKIGQKVYVGSNDRTNLEGIEQLKNFISPYGYETIPVPITKVLHLKSAVTALPCGTMLVYPSHLAPNELEIFSRANDGKILFVPEEHAQVVVLDDKNILMSTKAPKTAEILRKPPYNLNIVTVDVGEYVKLDGCVTCLSIRVR